MTRSKKATHGSLDLLSEEAQDAMIEEAADWCMRLHSAEYTPADQAAFQVWLQGDPRRATEYEAMLKLWDLSSQLSPSLSSPPKKPH